jgi:hypothetical protein
MTQSVSIRLDEDILSKPDVLTKPRNGRVPGLWFVS